MCTGLCPGTQAQPLAKYADLCGLLWPQQLPPTFSILLELLPQPPSPAPKLAATTQGRNQGTGWVLPPLPLRTFEGTASG